jgi:hypothetical protein
MNKVIWIIGQMCVGKTHYSKLIGEMIDVKPFHLDHIDQSLPLVEAYREAVKSGLIEGFTPQRNPEHLKAITEALKGSKVYYILIAPPYSQWKENCKPIIANPHDENPPDYTEEEYNAENERLMKLEPVFVI